MHMRAKAHTQTSKHVHASYTMHAVSMCVRAYVQAYLSQSNNETARTILHTYHGAARFYFIQFESFVFYFSAKPSQTMSGTRAHTHDRHMRMRYRRLRKHHMHVSRTLLAPCSGLRTIWPGGHKRIWPGGSAHLLGPLQWLANYPCHATVQPLHTHAHPHMEARTRTLGRTLIHPPSHSSTHVQARTCTHARTHTHAHTHARTHVHAHAHMHTYIHTCEKERAPSCSPSTNLCVHACA